MQVRTLPELFQRAVHEHGPRTGVRYHRDGGWHPITYGQLGRLVEEAALGLIQAGLGPGDVAAVVARNGPQAAIGELATLHAGASVLALDPSHVGRLADMDRLELPAAFVGPTTSVAEVEDRTAAGPATVVELAASPAASAAQASQQAAEGRRRSMAQLYREGQQAAREGSTLDERVQAVEPAEPAYLVPTEGGARVLTHDAVLTEARALASIVELAVGQRCLSASPVDDPLQRSAGRFAPLVVGAEAWLSRSPERLASDLQACRPELLVASPAAYAAIREALEERLAASEASQRRLFTWARSIGAERERANRDGDGPGLKLRARHLLADRLVLGKTRAAIGLERVQAALAPAAIEPELARWLASLGLPLLQAYRPPGAGGLVAIQRPAAPEGLGRPLPGVEVRVDGEEDELLARGPAVGTVPAEADQPGTDEDGWLHTGQPARFDGGHLYLAAAPTEK